MNRCIPIAMWDFSWLERRWSGAGYEDWGAALDALVERGYEAVRIDAYPHLISADLQGRWHVGAHWWFLNWGTIGDLTIEPWPALVNFLEACRVRNVKVLLSSWYREDSTQRRLEIGSPEVQAAQWALVMRLIEQQGLADVVMGVDLCNEFPGDVWAPFFDNSPASSWDGTTKKAMSWAGKALVAFRSECPSYETTVSFSGFAPDLATVPDGFTFLEPHIWMSQLAGLESMLCPQSDRTSPDYLNALARHGERLYRSHQEEWLSLLVNRIHDWAYISKQTKLPLVTTEGWAVVDVRDWPLFDWGWIKEICEVAIDTSVETGCWSAMCTSNFCGPQFEGMWRDVEWHRRQTEKIKRASLVSLSRT